MSTDTDNRARAEAAWNALSDAERHEAVAPADGLAASMAVPTWIHGHMAGQRETQQALDTLRRQKKTWIRQLKASIGEIAQLQEALTAQVAITGEMSDKVTASAEHVTRLHAAWAREAESLGNTIVEKQKIVVKQAEEITRLKEQLEAMRG